MLEIYGQLGCPFAWRVRFAAHEKGVDYQWIPVNVPHPDPRVATHDPDGRSPLVMHDGLRLTESFVIEQYIDEAFPGRALQSDSPRARALSRMLAVSFDGLGPVVRGEEGEEAMNKMLAVHGKIDAALGDALTDAIWLDGQRPGLTDIALLPLLARAEQLGHRVSPRFVRLGPYWKRGQAYPGLRASSAAVVAPQVG